MWGNLARKCTSVLEASRYHHCLCLYSCQLTFYSMSHRKSGKRKTEKLPGMESTLGMVLTRLRGRSSRRRRRRKRSTERKLSEELVIHTHSMFVSTVTRRSAHLRYTKPTYCPVMAMMRFFDILPSEKTMTLFCAYWHHMQSIWDSSHRVYPSWHRHPRPINSQIAASLNRLATNSGDVIKIARNPGLLEAFNA